MDGKFLFGFEGYLVKFFFLVMCVLLLFRFLFGVGDCKGLRLGLGFLEMLCD